jgi:DNA-binding HxlR family transcriptional regulator
MSEPDHAETPPPMTCEQQLLAVFGLLGKRWSGIVVGTLLQRPARFRELANAIPGISDSVLNERLRELMAAGLIERELADIPQIAVLYKLTAAGADLRPALEELRAWADRHGYAPDPA